jgi:hypothetical protein
MWTRVSCRGVDSEFNYISLAGNPKEVLNGSPS